MRTCFTTVRRLLAVISATNPCHLGWSCSSAAMKFSLVAALVVVLAVAHGKTYSIFTDYRKQYWIYRIGYKIYKVLTELKTALI